MPNSPIQVVLNAEDFRTVRDTPAGYGPATDFFANRDEAFERHKKGLQSQVAAVRQAVIAQGEVGYAKVTLRRSAWAKSHRPLTALFRPDRTPLVGGDDLGQMVVEVSTAALDALHTEIQLAEPETRPKAVGSQIKFNPTRRRSEVGAVERIELYRASDKRRFSVDQAVSWLRNNRTGGAYSVELFEMPPPVMNWAVLSPRKRALFGSFVDGLRRFGGGLVGSATKARPVLALRLSRAGDAPKLEVREPHYDERRGGIAPFDDRLELHVELVAFLDAHPLVRRVDLPSLPVRSEVRSGGRTHPGNVALPERAGAGGYPRIGVIDGGLGAPLGAWVIGRWGFMSDEDRNPEHGTFIGGLLVGAQAFNGEEVAPERDGCELVDIDVYRGMSPLLSRATFPMEFPASWTRWRMPYMRSGQNTAFVCLT